MSTPTRLAPTRRTVLRTAVWTAPAVSIAVAAPAFATSHVAICTTSGRRTGSNFYVTLSCNVKVTSVQIGTATALYDGKEWHARLTGVGQISSTQPVTITTDHGPVSKSVTFVG